MDVAVEEKSPVSKVVSVTLQEADLAKDIEKRLKKLGKRVKVHGFRPGKVPKKILQKKYGDSVRFEAIDDAVRRSLSEALDRDDLEGTVHVSQPELKGGLKPGEPVEYEFVAERLPTVEAKDYEGVDVQIEKVEVSDEDVAAELERMQDEHAVVAPVEDRDVIEAGDQVVCSYQGQGEGEIEEIHAEDQTIDLGDEALLPGFADGLVGAKVGDETNVEVELPEDFSLESIAGQKVTLAVTVSAIKVREVPALDDAFASEVGDFDTIDALREDIRTRLTNDRTKQAEVGAKRRMIEAVVANNPVDLPPLYVEARANEEARMRLQSIMGQGIDISQLGIDPREFAAGLQEDVGKAIHESIILRSVAAAQDIEVSDEDVEAAIKQQAEESGQPLARLKARYSVPEARDNLRSRLAYDRVVDWLWEKAKVEEVDELPEEENPAHGEEGHVQGPDCE